MDKVVFIWIGNKIYVGDRYKDTLKQVTFKSTDYWEVYHEQDLLDLLEYMNYPLHYNQFKNSEIQIIYTDAKVYRYLYKVADKLKYSEGITLQRLEPILIVAANKQDIQTESIFKFADQYYQLQEKDKEYALITLEEAPEQVTNTIAIKDICGIEDLPTKVVKVEALLETYILFSPRTIYQVGTTEKKKLFQAEDIIDQASLLTEGTPVEVGDSLMQYVHTVYKGFGKEQRDIIEEKSPVKGNFYLFPRKIEGTLWAERDEPIGMVSKRLENKEQVSVQLEQLGIQL